VSTRNHRERSTGAGFALIAVVWVVAVVTVISMELVASIGLEARGATARLEALKLERLALGGHEMAAYLDQRGLVGPNAEQGELPGDIPIDVLTPGTAYRVRFPGGSALVQIGAENGKASLSTSPPEALAAVFTRWTGDPAEGERLARAVIDWRDPDPLTLEGNAESAEYTGAGIVPRNRAVGIGDAHLVAGMDAGDFLPALGDSSQPGQHWLLPEGIYSLVTPIPTDGRINPNFAPVPILETLPGVDEEMASRLAELREDRLFENIPDLQLRSGILPGADTWNAITLGAGSTRTVTVIAGNDAGMRQVRRRVRQSMSVYNQTLNQMEPRLLVRSDTRFDTEVRRVSLP
jgi:general secretion pathway protein K